jgi:hypothetical protein
MDVSGPESASAPKPPATTDGLHKYSCVSCHKRKVKCDRQEPCGYCSRHDDQCVYQEPLPPRKRRREAESTEDLRRKLEHYQALARQNGATINDNGELLNPVRIDRTTQAASPQPQYGVLRPGKASSVTVKANSTTTTPGSGTLADALRDASREVSVPRKQEGCNEGRLVADKGKTRYLEKYVSALNPHPFIRALSEVLVIGSIIHPGARCSSRIHVSISSMISRSLPVIIESPIHYHR